jgi:hypothetical protein
MKVRIGLMFGSLLAGALFLGAVTMGQQPQAPPQVPAPLRPILQVLRSRLILWRMSCSHPI